LNTLLIITVGILKIMVNFLSSDVIWMYFNPLLLYVNSHYPHVLRSVNLNYVLVCYTLQNMFNCITFCSMRYGKRKWWRVFIDMFCNKVIYASKQICNWHDVCHISFLLTAVSITSCLVICRLRIRIVWSWVLIGIWTL
jgi:hypothetical protein